jgi:hypothetical protein
MIKEIPIENLGKLRITQCPDGSFAVEFNGLSPDRDGVPDRYPNLQTAIDQGTIFVKRLLLRAIVELENRNDSSFSDKV